MAARIEIEAGLRKLPGPDKLQDYGPNGLRAEARRKLACAARGQHAGRHGAGSRRVEPS